MSILYQIYYADYQREHLYKFAKPYYNTDLTIFFENEPIRKLVMETEADQIGVVSWKLSHPEHSKLQWNIGRVVRPEQITEELINREYDVLSFTRNTDVHQMIAAANNWHPGFKDTLMKLLSSVGIKFIGETKKPIYQNAFMAKREIYQDYVKTYLAPIMDLVKNDPEFYKLATVDSNYTKLNKKDSASPETLQTKIGMPYYPLIPFILERLFSIYCTNKNINVTWL